MSRPDFEEMLLDDAREGPYGVEGDRVSADVSGREDTSVDELEVDRESKPNQ
jgi:hypothetical protein